MLKRICLLLFLYQVTSIKSQLTNDQKCQISDSTCMTKTAQKLLPYLIAGIPRLGIDSLDVMLLDKLNIDFSGLHLNMKDVEISGLKDAVIEDITWNMKKKILNIQYRSDIIVKGKYKASGNFLILPISGDGDVTLEIKNHYVKLHMPFEIEKKEGKSYIVFKNHEYDFGVDGYLRINFTDLFNGNKPLSDALHRFINENWKEVSQTFGKPALKKPVSRVYKAIKKYLESEPLENLLLNH